MRKSTLIISCLLIAFAVSAQQPKQKAKAGQSKTAAAKKEKRIDDWEMKQYFLVYLKKGPNRSQDSATAAKIQSGHLEHLTKMYNEGKMDLAGPLMDDSDVAGICVYNVATLEEVKKLAESDPAVKSGRLIAEIHPWYAAKGSVLR